MEIRLAKVPAIWHPSDTMQGDANTYKLEPEQPGWKLVELFRLVPAAHRENTGVV